MSAAVLDASALLAFLLDEDGGAAVRRFLPGAALSAVNYAETLTKLIDRGKPLDEAVAGVARLRLEVVPFDRETAAVASSLRGATAALGLSHGDRACLALGLVRRVPVVTADRAWTRLDVGIRVTCIR